jgi:hypothetical protein
MSGESVGVHRVVFQYQTVRSETTLDCNPDAAFGAALLPVGFSDFPCSDLRAAYDERTPKAARPLQNRAPGQRTGVLCPIRHRPHPVRFRLFQTADCLPKRLLLHFLRRQFERLNEREEKA